MYWYCSRGCSSYGGSIYGHPYYYYSARDNAGYGSQHPAVSLPDGVGVLSYRDLDGWKAIDSVSFALRPVFILRPEIKVEKLDEADWKKPQ